jgi:hypothetical protein
MKRAFLSAAILGASISPALAGSGGAVDTGFGALLLKAIGNVFGKLYGMF